MGLLQAKFMHIAQYSVCALVAFLAQTTSQVAAVELKVLSVGAMAPTLRQFMPEFERSSGHFISAWFGPPAAIRDKIIGGEYADIVFTSSPTWDELIQRRMIQDGVVVARAGVGLGIRKGATKPDIRTADRLKKALLDAKSIGGGRFDNGSIGTQTLLGFQKLGIAEQILPKYRVFSGGDALVQALVKDEIEIGLSVVADMAASNGIDYAGPFPPGIQEYIMIRAATTVGSTNVNAAGAFIGFASRPDRSQLLKTHWLEPAM
jgi:molybdate transport system substrate-binding protein